MFSLLMSENSEIEKSMKFLPKNTTYRSPDIQNDLIEAMAKYVRNRIVQKLNASPFLTILTDGTKDRHGLEIISIAFRFLQGSFFAKVCIM